MRRVILGIIMISALNMLFPVAFGAGSKPAKADARHVIGRSAAIVLTAQRFAAQGQKYQRLGLAVAHQVYSRELYMSGFYFEAISHSIRARVLAANIIKQNKGESLIGALFDRMEEKYAQEIPSGRELDQKLREANVEIMSDQEAAGAQLNLDVD
jgi:hypothetical protein